MADLVTTTPRADPSLTDEYYKMDRHKEEERRSQKTDLRIE